jgi:outer membrane protein assembly factor BamE
MRNWNLKNAGALLLASGLALSMTACSSWIYRIDVPQGNFLEQKDINKLRVQMTKEQVQFVLGNPVAENSFEDNTWHYFYQLKGGRGDNFEKQLVLNFKDDKLVTIRGDFETPKEFNTPLDQ